MNYEYVARDGQGVQRTGLFQGDSEREVLDSLRDQGLIPVRIEVISAKGSGQGKKSRRGRVKSEEMASFCWQLNTMVEGGVVLTEALDTISSDIENLEFQDTLQQVRDRIKTGETFSDSLAEHPRVFSPLFRAMIVAGEAGGVLPTVLQRLAVYFESRDTLKRKIRGAMAYPVFVFGFVSFMVVVLMTFIIPRFRVIFDQLKGELPVFTKAFMGVYDVIIGKAWLVVLLILLATVLLVAYHRTEKGHARLSRLVLSIPFVGGILRHGFICVFCRTMSTLLMAGVPIIDALNILSGMSNNHVIKSAIVNTRAYIVEGSNISISMAASGFFPNMVSKMVQVGEGSGSLPVVLDRTSNYYEKRVDVAVKRMTGFIEPALIITVGLIVLAVVLALYLPIFTMSDASG